jgi:hypothetical protein
MSRRRIAGTVMTTAFFAAMTSCTTENHEASAEAPGDLVAYDDTVAIVGGVEETNPLFLWENENAELLDDSTLAYAEDVRLVVANMVAGMGWEKTSPAGAEGPGEFDGDRPFLFPQLGELFTITFSGIYNVFSSTGSLISSGRIPPNWWGEFGQERTRIVGVAGNRVVTTYMAMFDRAGPPVQTLRQGFRVYDLAGTPVLDLDSLPGQVWELVEKTDTNLRTRSSGGGLFVEARGDCIAYLLNNVLTTMDPDGKRIASRELDWRAGLIRMDAAGRVWVNMSGARDEASGAPVTVVFDRELNELFRVAERRIRSSSANAILTSMPDSLGANRLVLLRRSTDAPASTVDDVTRATRR